MVARSDRRRESEQAAPSAQRPAASQSLRRCPPSRPIPACPPRPTCPHLPTLFLLIASATVGFAFFLMELVWYRLLGAAARRLGLHLRPRPRGRARRHRRRRPALLAGRRATGPRRSPASPRRCLLEAAAVAATFALGDRVALLALALLPLGAAGFAATIAGWTLVTAIVVLPPAFVAGYQFPLLIALFGRGRDARPRRRPRLRGQHRRRDRRLARRRLRPAAVAVGARRVAARGGRARRARRRRGGRSTSMHAARAKPPETSCGSAALRSPVALALAVVTLLLLTAAGPTAVWRHSGIGAGRAPRDVFSSPNQLRAWEQRRAPRDRLGGRRRREQRRAGRRADRLRLHRQRQGRRQRARRRRHAGDARPARRAAASAAAARAGHRPRHRQHAPAGWARSRRWSASTSSSSSRWSLDVARACAPVNHDVLHNPKVHVTIGDARETLLTTPRRYDVIASEPSNPFRAGIASLFTLEYYRAAQRAADRRRRVRAVGAGLRDRRADAAHHLRDAGRGVSAGRDVADQPRRPRAARDDAAARLQRRGAARAHRRGAVQDARSPNAWRAVDIDGVLAHYVATDARGARVRRARRASRSTPTIATSSSSAWRGRSAAPASSLRRRAPRARARRWARRVRRSTPTPASRGRPSTPPGRTSSAGTSPPSDAARCRRTSSRARRRCGATTRPATSRARASCGDSRSEPPRDPSSWRWRPTSKRKRARTRRCR